MCSGKSVEPRMVPWGTKAVTGYSPEDFPSKTTWSHLLPRKEEIRPNIWPKNFADSSLWTRPAWQTLSKALDISSATAPVASEPLKTLAILSDTTVRRSAVDQKDLKTILEIKKGHITLCDQQSHYL